MATESQSGSTESASRSDNGEEKKLVIVMDEGDLSEEIRKTSPPTVSQSRTGGGDSSGPGRPRPDMLQVDTEPKPEEDLSGGGNLALGGEPSPSSTYSFAEETFPEENSRGPSLENTTLAKETSNSNSVEAAESGDIEGDTSTKESKKSETPNNSSANNAVKFDWKTYLAEMRSEPAPKKCFFQTEDTPVNDMEEDTKVECRDPRGPGKLCLANIEAVLGPFVCVRLLGCDSSNDRWLLCDDSDIQYVGYSRDKGKGDIEPPVGYLHNMAKFRSFIEQQFEEGSPATKDMLYPISADLHPEANFFEVGMKLEAIDPRNFMGTIHPASILKVDGDQIEIGFDGWPKGYNMGCRYDSRYIFPIGWAVKAALKLEPPPKLKPGKQSTGTGKRKEAKSATPDVPSKSKSAVENSEKPASNRKPRGRPKLNSSKTKITPTQAENSRKSSRPRIPPVKSEGSGQKKASTSKTKRKLEQSENEKKTAPASKDSSLEPPEPKKARGLDTKPRKRGRPRTIKTDICDDSPAQPTPALDSSDDDGESSAVRSETKKKQNKLQPNNQDENPNSLFERLAPSAFRESRSNTPESLDLKPTSAYSRASGVSVSTSPGSEISSSAPSIPPKLSGEGGSKKKEAVARKSLNPTPWSKYSAKFPQIVSENKRNAMILKNSTAAPASEEMVMYVNKGCKVGEWLDEEHIRRTPEKVGPASPAQVLRESLQLLLNSAHSNYKQTLFHLIPQGSSQFLVTAGKCIRYLPVVLGKMEAWSLLSQVLSKVEGVCPNLFSGLTQCTLCQGSSSAASSSSEKGKKKTGSNPEHWTVEQVAQFMSDLEETELPDLFRSCSIDGRAMFLLTPDLCMTYMKLRLGPALKICSKIEELKKAHGAS